MSNIEDGTDSTYDGDTTTIKKDESTDEEEVIGKAETSIVFKLRLIVIGVFQPYLNLTLVILHIRLVGSYF